MVAEAIERETHGVYIEDQAWSICTAWTNPWPQLSSNLMRTRRDDRRPPIPLADGGDDVVDAWKPFELDDLVHGQYQAGDDVVGLDRVVITTDAGLGKTVATKYLAYRIAAQRPGTLVERLTFRDLRLFRGGVRDGDDLVACLTDRIQTRIGSESVAGDAVKRMIQRKRRSGQLVLIVDGLDEAGDISLLRHLCGNESSNPDWAKTRIIVAGRPYSVRRYRDDVFQHRGWRFVRLEEFGVRQIKRFLGEERFQELPEGSREILGVPRVLEYLRQVDTDRISDMKRPADVYYAAMEHLLRRGFEKSVPARLLGTDHADGTRLDQPHANNIPKAFELLGLIAYEMTCTTVADPTYTVSNDDPDADVEIKTIPNFVQIPIEDHSMDDFRRRLMKRYVPDRGISLDRELECVRALNQVLDQGIFDTDSVTGFQFLQFRNRSLQEFMCAHYLATHAEPKDAERLWDWIYLPFESDTAAYYHIWQFLCDMPRNNQPKVPYGAVRSHWLTAIEPLFLRGKQETNGHGHTAWRVKRSTEMIFRCWQQLDADCSVPCNQARAIRRHWRGEFEDILKRDGLDEIKRVAQGIVDGFIRLPGTEETGKPFIMGTTADKQSKFDEEFWGPVFKALQEVEAAVGRDRAVEHFIETRLELAPLQKIERSWWIEVCQTLVEAGSIEPMRVLYSVPDEPRIILEIPPFELARSTVTNAEFRLFAPKHGKHPKVESFYRTYSQEDDQPAVMLTWYDAFSFTQWLRWEGKSCQLPRESEWEYACKFDTPWDQRFWWGDTFDSQFANAEGSNRYAMKSAPGHASEASKRLDAKKGDGLMEMLGNVSEWCLDHYRRRFDPDAQDIPGTPGASRVLRGGSFSVSTGLCRSAYRGSVRPGNSYRSVGLRVARA